MKARIRYSKFQEGWLISTTSFEANGKSVKASINSSSNKFRILNSTDHSVLEEGEGVNDHDLKKKVKAKLKDMGVEFAPERRDRNVEDLLQALNAE